MAVGVFPAAKLGVLAIKQIAKPIANVIKQRAKNSLFFRQYICMPPAQFYNWVEVKTKMWALNLGKPMAVPKLTEAMAIELGANLLGETIIFVIGAGILVLEYTRQSKKETLKEQMIQQEKMELQAMLNELAFQAERQDTQIRELTRVIAEMDSKSWVNPTKLVDIVTGSKKKIQQNEDERLQLLPERRSNTPRKPATKEVSNDTTATSSPPGILFNSLSFLIHDLKLLNYSGREDFDGEQIISSGGSALDRAVNELFIINEDDKH